MEGGFWTTRGFWTKFWCLSLVDLGAAWALSSIEQVTDIPRYNAASSISWMSRSLSRNDKSRNRRKRWSRRRTSTQGRNRSSCQTCTRGDADVAVPCVRRARREEREFEEQGREMVGEGEDRRRGTREGESRHNNLLLVNTWWPSLETRWRSWSSLAQVLSVEARIAVIVELLFESW